jgi:DNA (cytosine-5)-methyltransferase 1
MNYLDLFSGIGGFALGAYWAGMKFDNHLCSDVEKYPVELYKKRFPDSIQLGDITKIDWHKLKKDFSGEWIITGGFPCQDISIAGKGKGLIDEKTGERTRSGLWFDYWKGISILRPRFVIIENVRALLNRELETVLANLSEIGYNAEWQIISAEDMGAPHKRERIWIVAYPLDSSNRTKGRAQEKTNSIPGKCRSEGFSGVLGGTNENDRKMADTESQGGERRKTGIKSKQTQCRTGIFRWGDTGEISATDSKGLERGKKTRNVEIKRENGEQLITRQSECNGENYWATEPCVGELVDGLSSGLDRFEGRLTVKSHKRASQLKGLGNAIVPQIAELLFNQIKGLL